MAQEIGYIKLAPFGSGFEFVFSQWQEAVPAHNTVCILRVDEDGMVRGEPVHPLNTILEVYQTEK